MFHIVLCDDEKSITDHLKELLEKKYKSKISCKCVYSAADLRTWIEEQDEGKTNIIILDIALGDEDGILLAKEIRSKYPQIKVILLSGYAQLASNVFDADPVYFLSKPINTDKLYASVEKAMAIVQNQEIIAITVASVDGKIYRVKVSDIVYIETRNRYCRIYLENNDYIDVLSKLSNLMNSMPDYIINTHQSFACNTYKVKSFSKEEGIVTLNGCHIPVSRRHYKNVKNTIALHI